MPRAAAVGRAVPVLFSLALSLVLSLSLALPLAAQAGGRRPLRVDDLSRLRSVSDPQRSPDGEWVAYTVSTVDTAKDRSGTDIWMTSWTGDRTLQLTATPESESDPRFSPDGKYLSFLSSRGDAKETQLWLMNRAGGEAVRVTSMPGGVSDYAWSPDGRKIVLVATDADSAAADSTAPPRPIVITRYRFKSDGGGYLGNRRDHLYLFDVATRSAEQLTSGTYDESEPAWSPDGREIAFVSNRSAPDPDRSENTDIFVMEARAGATPRQLTSFEGPDDGPPAWSPDGKLIAYLQGSEPRYSAYNLDRLAVVPASGGAPRILTGPLDRSVSSPRWTSDGAALVFLYDDDRAGVVGRVARDGGSVERLTSGPQVVIAATPPARDGSMALLVSDPMRPPEVYALGSEGQRRITRQNDAWLAGVQLGRTEGITARSADGTVVNGLLITPPGYVAGQRLPAILRIHGGPNGQDQYEFHFERQLLAAQGYVVYTANYRGSSGRGAAYSTSIFADWGNKEVQDLLAMTNRVISLGVADSTRLGIGGWSYGAILTNYTIATTQRFKAATSGAGSSMQTAMYGTDQYIVQYELELGPPWKNPDAWTKVSYPFFKADRITTPTLFLGGDRDFNVPLLGGEQMYQALRSLGVATELVIYPGQHHAIMRPSFQRDRLERYVGWYGRYLAPGAAGTAARGAQ